MTNIELAGSQSHRLLGACLACASPLPLRLPEAGEESLEWVCVGCGTAYNGILLENWPAEFRRNVRPADSQLRESGSEGLAAWCDEQPPDPISIVLPDHKVVPCELETPFSREFDAQIDRREGLQIRPQGEPFIGRIRKHGAQPYDKDVMNRLAQLLQRSSEQLKELYAYVNGGGSAEVRVVESISKDALFRVAEDMDLFVCLGIAPGSGAYPSRHGLRVSMLAMSIGATLGWDEQTLINLGIGCLLHDVGMLAVDGVAYRTKRFLSAADFAEITKHPVLAVESLGRYLSRVPAEARMVAYQMHERCNGSGYPRGYAETRIHDLAKVAAVADVFTALVSPRPHRPGMVPYHALRKILDDTNAGLYDSHAVRALLKTISLFPIGSYVALDDGRVGRVIRATGDCYDRPVVEAWRRDDPLTGRTVIDLSRQDSLRIKSSLAGPS